MNLLYFCLFGVIIFLSVFLGGKRFRNTALYALAIGGVVNANFFNANNYPIDIFGLTFGIDSIIYTLFVFCVIIMFFKEGKGSAYLLAVSSVIAIFISAVLQLIAETFTYGNSVVSWKVFLSFIISCLASIGAVVAMLELLDKIKNKGNKFVLLIIGTLVATFVNSFIYYPLSTLLNGYSSNLWTLLLSSLVGKFIALVISIFTFWLLNLYDKQGSRD